MHRYTQVDIERACERYQQTTKDEFSRLTVERSEVTGGSRYQVRNFAGDRFFTSRKELCEALNHFCDGYDAGFRDGHPTGGI